MTHVSPPAVDARRERFSIEAITAMVDNFYALIREDDELGPIFNSRIDDWPHHLQRMVFFWRAVLRSEPTFHISERGAPPVLHWAMDEVRRPHYGRWLELFGGVVAEIFEPEDAEQVLNAAHRIAHAFSRHLPHEEEDAS